MANDAHREITHHPATGHGQEASQKDLIHHVHDLHQSSGRAEASKPEAHKPDVHKPDASVAKFNQGYGNCDGQWTHLVSQWVTKNEISKKKFQTFVPNDAGHGISVGILQWNQKKGSLTNLFQDFHHKDPAKFDHMFGKYATGVQNAKWVHKADFNRNPELNKAVRASLADPEFQKVQINLREKQMAHSCELAQRHGFKSLRGRAVAADIFNQTGPTGLIDLMNQVPKNLGESQRIELLKKAAHNRPHNDERNASYEPAVKEIWRQLGTGHIG